MLNLDPNDVVTYTDKQQQAIDELIDNRGERTGQQLWEVKGDNAIFDDIKNVIRHHCLKIQRVKCAYCETLFDTGSVEIEHYAHKAKYPQFLYEPLNLLCSCHICNSFAKKGTNDTIKGTVRPCYTDNEFH